ncbi:type II toxin-antitoxin system RelE/ParE family toxin [uncultured Megasphaera sp.]|uniref:type II toxin-antitoxin system RelE/ParE family toxin n=1 Tax=uncultured Megasphaera sp. TaxID=165188 RepID=UPI002594062E|nr:type II toxin-antitoxin system RelE/ParE family toxin [uncultured Megasphaera sp.]
MEIHYKNKKIHKICTNANAARKNYGQEMARKIHQRIDELTAADSVETMLQYRIGRCHRLTGNREGQYALDLVQPYRLIFIQLNDEIQIVEVQEIVDYH